MTLFSKRIFRIAAFAAMALILFGAASCTQDKASFNVANLYGKWQYDAKKTEYWIYNADGSGKTWDESEVTEADAQAFTWTLTEDNLVIVHLIGGKEQVPKSYTLMTLTSSVLKYKDSYKEYSFTKVSSYIY